MLTVHPDRMARGVLTSVDPVIALGSQPDATMRAFANALGDAAPPLPTVTLEPNEALVWLRNAEPAPFRVAIAPSHVELRRHRRKYAEGDVGEGKSFYFRGPENKL